MDRMEHYTITAPLVRNDGRRAPYVQDLCARLLAEGICGWTETPSTGYWRGKREDGVVFTIYLPVGSPADTLARLSFIGRRAMPDQEAVQVTYHGTILLIEG